MPSFAIPEGFVVTQPGGGGVARSPPLSMVAIDCEMCYTGAGSDRRLELTRPLDVEEPHQLLNDAFAIVPEVGTVPMWITGLAFFAAVCRARQI